MTAAEIVPGETSVIFFEPDGLLLLAYLRPAAERFDHSLVLQMTYLGAGEIDVDVVLVAARSNDAAEPYALHSNAPLGRTGESVPPMVWSREVAVSTDSSLLWIVRGQSGPDRPLRGELRSTVTCRPSLVAVETRAGVTRE